MLEGLMPYCLITESSPVRPILGPPSPDLAPPFDIHLAMVTSHLNRNLPNGLKLVGLLFNILIALVGDARATCPVAVI